MTANEMLQHVVGSLRGYPNAGGDIQVMTEVDRIVSERTNKLREACEFAIGAIEDAISCEDGLDGKAGEAVLKMLRAALGNRING